MKLSVIKLDPELPDPKRAHPDDAGLDLRARHPAELAPTERATIATGVAVAIPSGHAGLIVPRSGLASRYGIGLVNAPGLVDPGYRGELKVILVNLGERRRDISRGDRIAQLVIVPMAPIAVEIVDRLDETERGSRGFGSSGR